MYLTKDSGELNRRVGYEADSSILRHRTSFTALPFSSPFLPCSVLGGLNDLFYLQTGSVQSALISGSNFY